MEESKKTVINNTLALFINQVIAYLFPFIIVPYLSRIYSVDMYGRINYAQAVVEYFTFFISFGLGYVGIREVAINRDNPDKVNKIFSTIFYTQCILFVISFIILMILCSFPKFSADYRMYFLILFQQIGIVLYSSWFYQGVEDMKFITILNFVSQVLEIVLTFSFIKSDEDYLLWLILIVFSLFITGITSFIIRKKYFKIKHVLVSLKDIWENLKTSSQFFLTEISVYLYRQINIVILGLVESASVVAYFSTANKLFIAGSGVCYALMFSMFPYMSKNKDSEFFKKILFYFSLFGILVSILIFVFAKPIICLIYSDKYIEAAKVLQIFSFAFVLHILVTMLGLPFLAAYGYIKETNRCYVLGAVYNTLGLAVMYFMGKITLYNVAILAASTYLIMFFHRIYYVLKYRLLIPEK